MKKTHFLKIFLNKVTPRGKTNFTEDKNSAINFAKQVLKNKDDYLILDVETTGLGNDDVVTQIGIIDMEGNIILDSLIKPTMIKEISVNVTAITGINMKMLDDAPTFRQLYPKFQEIVKGKQLLAYKADFDLKYLIETSRQDGFQTDGLSIKDVSENSAKFNGEWIEARGAYKIPLLSTGDESVIEYCRTTLNTLSEMAQSDLIPVSKSKPWWKFWN